jgi:hypothetical protein
MKNSFPLSTEQRAVYDHVIGGGSAAADACAGSGKSHTARAVALNFNGNVESVPFGRQLADTEIATYADFSNINSLNFHRRGYRLLGGKVVLNSRKLHNLADGMEIDDEDIHPEAVAGLAEMFKAEAVGCGFEHQLELEEIATKYGYSASLIPYALECLKLSDAKTDEVDFHDQLRFPVLFGRQAFLSGLIILDEVQDYTPAAFVFLTRCLVKKGSQVLMIGDVDQCLQAFAGARADLFAIMADYFGCERFQITENRRCSKAVVRNAPRLSKAVKALDEAPEGSVSVKPQSEVFDAILAGNHKEDAVISEANAPLVTFGLSLLIQGVPVQMRTARLEKLIYRYIPFRLLDTRKTAIGEIANKARLEVQDKDGVDQGEARDVLNAVEALESFCLAKGIIKTQFRKDGRKFIPIHPIMQALKKLCSGTEGITLLTGHTAKGLEWETVFHLPGKVKAPEQDWQHHQAACLDYVIKTRAKLHHVTLQVPESNEGEQQ